MDKDGEIKLNHIIANNNELSMIMQNQFNEFKSTPVSEYGDEEISIAKEWLGEMDYILSDANVFINALEEEKTKTDDQAELFLLDTITDQYRARIIVAQDMQTFLRNVLMSKFADSETGLSSDVMLS